MFLKTFSNNFIKYLLYFQTCPIGYFTCNSGSITCIQEIFRCDCTSDCDDSSDETVEWAGCAAYCADNDAPGLLFGIILPHTFVFEMYLEMKIFCSFASEMNLKKKSIFFCLRNIFRKKYSISLFAKCIWKNT